MSFWGWNKNKTKFNMTVSDYESDLDYDEEVSIVHGLIKSIKIPSVFIWPLLRKKTKSDGEAGTGPGKSQMKAIEEQSGAKIKVTIVKNIATATIHGEADKIKLAERLIYERIGGGKLSSKRIRVSQSQVAKIIGRRGATIKMIQGSSGASIRIAQTRKDRERENDATVEICGTEDQITQAEDMIEKATWRIEPVSHMTRNLKIIKLKQLDDEVKEQDVINLFLCSASIPKIKIRTEKAGVRKYAALKFPSVLDAKEWMNLLDNEILGQRRIIRKDKD